MHILSRQANPLNVKVGWDFCPYPLLRKVPAMGCTPATARDSAPFSPQRGFHRSHLRRFSDEKPVTQRAGLRSAHYGVQSPTCVRLDLRFLTLEHYIHFIRVLCRYPDPKHGSLRGGWCRSIFMTFPSVSDVSHNLNSTQSDPIIK